MSKSARERRRASLLALVSNWPIGKLHAVYNSREMPRCLRAACWLALHMEEA